MAEAPPLRWSETFSILPRSTASFSNLRGDKIALPQSALEQLLAASSSQQSPGAASTSRTPLDPYRAFGHGLADRGAEQQLPNPLMFRLENPANKNVVFAGIREFSAPEGSIALSPFLMETLGIDQQDLAEPPPDTEMTDADGISTHQPQPKGVPLKVQSRQLPKGTYVRLRPLEAGYNPDNWKPLLERQLRDSFTTLTNGAVLSVQGATRGETFKFLVDKLAPEDGGVCVVDTDIEVDIEPLDEEQARETLRQITARSQAGTEHGSSKGGDIDIWKSVQGQVVPGEYVDYTLPSWNRSQTLDIALAGIPDDALVDLFVSPRSSRQRALPRDEAHVFGNFDQPRDGAKSISIAPSNVEVEEAEAILVSVHAYPVQETQGGSHEKSDPKPIPYTLRAKATVSGEPTAGVTEADGQQEHDADDEQCKNCLQWVPKRTMVLHENFCRRNNIVCPRCKSVFKRGSSEWESHWHCDLDEAYGSSTVSKTKHDDTFHGSHQCPACEFSTNALPDLARHQTSVCPGKIILCRFCHLEVPQEGDPLDPSPEVVLSGMTAHELADGARTTECHLCDKIIRLRDMEMHLKHHELDKVNRAKPRICRNINCGRTLHGVGPKGQVGAQNGGQNQSQGSNSLGLCATCFGPLYVSMHDPEGKALRRRVERRYLGQLMSGCGKSHCRNEWCRTGRANAGLEPKGSSSQAALPLVKPLLAAVQAEDAPLYFCVDEASQTRRKLAEMMAAERVWDLEWCVAASEAEKGNPDKMRDWLRAWAPTR